jgi:hypothetical protein
MVVRVQDGLIWLHSRARDAIQRDPAQYSAYLSR